jgi:hypothetical protein
MLMLSCLFLLSLIPFVMHNSNCYMLILAFLLILAYVNDIQLLGNAKEIISSGRTLVCREHNLKVDGHVSLHKSGTSLRVGSINELMNHGGKCKVWEH